jgi:hypothetical protein
MAADPGAVVSPLPANVRLLAELLAAQPRIDAAAGEKRVELMFKGGKLVAAFTHDRIGPGELEDLEVVSIPPESP